MSRAKPSQSPCPISEFLSVLAGPWTLHLLWVLGNDGPARFGELRRKVEGISARMLSDRLRLLEERGFIYRITERMKDINKVLAELDKVARKWGQEDSEHKPGRHAAESHAKPARPDARANHVPRPV